MSPFIIPVSDDSTNESIGSFAFLIILSDTDYEAAIPTTLPLRNMVIHLDSKSDPSEDPPLSDHAPVAPIIVPILLEDHSESDSESKPSKDDALEPYEATIAH
nr:hypothetical protein [Tanacetum cinerariifolium]